MNLYLDLIFIINFFFDFLLLSGVAVMLRRNIAFKRLLLGSLIGALSIFILFYSFSSLELFLIKFLISLVMTLVTFGYKDIIYLIKNLVYLYVTSILLGGFLYFLNIQFSYKNEGFIFYHHGISINFYVLLILSPIIIYIYIKQIRELKNNYANYYEVDVYFKDGKIKKLNGFLDTGNLLYDPYQKRPIILVDNSEIDFNYDDNNILLVPYDSLNYHGLLKCIIPEKIDIVGVGERYNVLIGISNKKIKMDGVNCILHNGLMEGKNV
jgi:stage II sporulation protein GA (sporulation sigma-E factor processing peptidase)